MENFFLNGIGEWDEIIRGDKHKGEMIVRAKLAGVTKFWLLEQNIPYHQLQVNEVCTKLRKMSYLPKSQVQPLVKFLQIRQTDNKDIYALGKEVQRAAKEWIKPSPDLSIGEEEIMDTVYYVKFMEALSQDLCNKVMDRCPEAFGQAVCFAAEIHYSETKNQPQPRKLDSLGPTENSKTAQTIGHNYKMQMKRQRLRQLKRDPKLAKILSKYDEEEFESMPTFGGGKNEDVMEFLEDFWDSLKDDYWQDDDVGAIFRSRLRGKAQEWLYEFEWVKNNFDYFNLEKELKLRFKINQSRAEHYAKFWKFRCTPGMHMTVCAEKVLDLTCKFAGVTENKQTPRPPWLEDALLQKFFSVITPEMQDELDKKPVWDFDEVALRAIQIEKRFQQEKITHQITRIEVPPKQKQQTIELDKIVPEVDKTPSTFVNTENLMAQNTKIPLPAQQKSQDELSQNWQENSEQPNSGKGIEFVTEMEDLNQTPIHKRTNEETKNKTAKKKKPSCNGDPQIPDVKVKRGRDNQIQKKGKLRISSQNSPKTDSIQNSGNHRKRCPKIPDQPDLTGMTSAGIVSKRNSAENKVWKKGWSPPNRAKKKRKPYTSHSVGKNRVQSAQAIFQGAVGTKKVGFNARGNKPPKKPIPRDPSAQGRYTKGCYQRVPPDPNKNESNNYVWPQPWDVGWPPWF